MSKAMNDVELIEALDKANRKLREYEKIMEDLEKPPLNFAEVLSVNGNRLRIVLDDNVSEVVAMPGVKAVVGNTVAVNKSGFVIGVVDSIPFGSIATVEKVIDDMVQVSVDGSRQLIFRGSIPVEESDMVCVRNKFVQRNLGKGILPAPEIVKVLWEDIGGLEKEKALIREVIELPVTHAKLFKKYKKKQAKGVLLYGPPGNGKTMLGKAAATALASIHGSTASTGFIYVKGPELLNMYVGATEANIRSLFKQAESHYDKHGYPAVIFIDEADSLLRRRGSGRSSDIEITTVATFLAEMDGLSRSTAIMFLTTNRPDTMDPAVLRDGRVDIKIKVGAPCMEGTKSILGIGFKDKPIAHPLTHKELANRVGDMVFNHSNNGLTGEISGAFLAELVEQSTMEALRREIKGGAVSGITLEDAEKALSAKTKMIEMMKG